MVQDRIIFSGSFLYRFPRKYPAYLEALCKNSPGISHMWPVFRRYAMLFFTSRMPSPSEGTPQKPPDARLGNSQIKIPVELLHTGVIVRMIYTRF